MTIWLKRLEETLVERDVQQGFALLDSRPDLVQRMAAADAEAIQLLLCVAQWVDLGYRDLAFLKACCAPFAHARLANLRLIDALKLKLANAFYALATEDVDECIAPLDFVLGAGNDILDPHIRFLAHFWRGRAHRKRGEYEAALVDIGAAREIAQRSNAPRLVGSVKIHEGWVLFQQGDRRGAARLMDEAESSLKQTGDALLLGNIESARGRFIRRSGDYAAALACFERAIELYSHGFSRHPNCARAFVNAAFVKGLIAHRIRVETGGKPVRGATHAKYLQVYDDALALLGSARKIYSVCHHQTGLGAVFVNCGHLHLETGNTDQAAAEARKAFKLGQEKRDPILMARTRILQSAIELALADEDLDGDTSANSRAAKAIDYAEEAIELGAHTQNKRLLAEAYLMRSAAAADGHFEDWETARSFANKAGDLLGEDDRDHLFNKLGAIKARILRANGIDHTLQQWSSGQVGNKTFQQIQEEFAEIVIPKVWLNLGKNVSRVSEQLSISPKKVRRILRNTSNREP